MMRGTWDRSGGKNYEYRNLRQTEKKKNYYERESQTDEGKLWRQEPERENYDDRNLRGGKIWIEELEMTGT